LRFLFCVQIFSTLSPIPGFLPWLGPKLALHCSCSGGAESPFAEELLQKDEVRSILQAVDPARLAEDW
jgi:hypothetical protein